MHPKEQLTADLKEAMKSGDAVRRTVIRSTLAAFREAEQRKREDLVKRALKKHNLQRPDPSDEEAIAVYVGAVDAALEAEQVDAGSELDESEALSVIQKLVKQRQDSIADAEKAGRADIAQNEQQEMEILQAYLPEQLSREEIEEEARVVIQQVGASGPRDMGKVMGPLMGRLQGRADGKLVSEVVRTLLSE